MADLVRQAREDLARVGLLGDVSTQGVVPDLVVRSWRRSLSNSVDSAAPCQRYSDVDTDSILCRAADPVLDRWQNHLADTATTLFLSDRAGNIVARRTSDSAARRRLDSVHAAEGFDYSEDSVGTNGLGTSMVEGRALVIQGSQHYNDALAALACAAAPVYTPTGAVIGSISLGGPIEDANPLMLSLTREIGHQIEERLRSTARPQDLALAMSFMRFTNSQRPTVVMDHESLLVNTPGLPYVDVTSHVLLWELLNAHDWSSGGAVRLQPDGTSVEVTARRILDGPRAHFVLHFTDLAQHRTPLIAPPLERHTIASIATPTASRVTDTAFVIVEGPPGSGRATVAADLRAQRRRGTDLKQITLSAAARPPWAAIDSSLAEGSDVLLRRAESVADSDADQLVRLIEQHQAAAATGQRTSILLLTTCRDRANRAVVGLIDKTGPAARTEPLSSTPERIPGLVKRILDRVDPNGRHTMSPAALQSFVQYRWPGNITELVDTLAALVSQVHASVIERRHLPRHLQQAPPRRHLTLIEAAERDAIIKALDAAAGNKSEAAALLGIGRTTLYRRLRQLGLDGGEDSL
jgi:sigma-54 dependent transcriptional regulator, acetoin dehydrogenase operon transcriptional activator AcoR